jgi:hypothetical protein
MSALEALVLAGKGLNAFSVLFYKQGCFKCRQFLINKFQTCLPALSLRETRVYILLCCSCSCCQNTAIIYFYKNGMLIARDAFCMGGLLHGRLIAQEAYCMGGLLHGRLIAREANCTGGSLHGRLIAREAYYMDAF